MQHDPYAAVRRVLTTAGITGAALTLTAAAALPAMACHQGGNGAANGGNGKPSSGQTSSGQSAASGQTQNDQRTRSAGADEHQGTTKTGTHDSKGGDKGSSASDTHGHKGAATSGKTEGHNPPGNNGTFFVKRTAGDSSPGNQPHVSCGFYLSFFGFDKNQTVSVTFAGQAPTGKDQPVAVTSGATTLTSTDNAGGAGNDYDGFLGPFGANLDLSKLGAPAKQGYHLKVDVATGQGGGHKYKVLWMTPCTPPASSTNQPSTNQPATNRSATVAGTGTTASTTGAPAGPATTDAGTVGGGAEVFGETLTRAPAGTSAGTPTTTVLGERLTRSPQATSATSLPFTGAETGLLAALGAAAVGGGAALTVAGRRRRAAARG